MHNVVKHTGHPALQGVSDYSVDRSPRTLILGFALIIIIGTCLLRLPAATENGIPISWADALFTATSATTVTGLVVLDTVNTFSTFGELVILALIQVGGMGFIIFSVALLRLVGRKVALGERVILRQIMGVTRMYGVVELALSVLIVTLGIELTGATLLFFSWLPDMGPLQAAYYAIFHAISAFCNAGFDLFQGVHDPMLIKTRQDPLAVFTLSGLIITGTLGITVIFDVVTLPKNRYLSLHSKIILPLMLLLILIGVSVILLDEALFSDALAKMMPGERWLAAFFTVVSSRTAGLTIIPLENLGEASQLIILISMLIGGAPASMGGGIGLTTMAVVFITLYTNVRGYPDVRVFARTLPTETIMKAVAIATVSIMLVITITMLILLIDDGSIASVAFEVVSAFSNTGYTLGFTPSLNPVSRVLIMFTMFWGRLGPLTIVLALARRNRHTQIKYPEEQIIIG